MVTRMSGLATGMDIDSIVQKLMAAHRAPVTKLEQKKATMTWQRDDYRAMNTKLLEFRTKLFDKYLIGTTFNQLKAEVTGNTTAISAKTTSSTASGNLSVEVDALATAASKRSSAAFVDLTASPAFDPTKKLVDEDAKLTGDFDYNNDGTNDVFKFKINGKEFTVDPAASSLNDVIQTINADKDANVSVFYDSTLGKLSFVAKSTGYTNGPDKAANITFEDTQGDMLSNVFKIANYTNTASPDTDPNAVQAVRADVLINGMRTYRDTNTFTVNGIEISLLEQGGAASNIEVKKDVDAIIESIKTLVKDYNDTLNALSSKVKEVRYRDYTPLTDEQRKEFKDKGYDLEEWEERAKSGLLRNDSILSRAVSEMRSAITSVVADTGSTTYNTLSSIGLNTTKYSKYSKENGNLVLDEAALRKALEENPDAVQKVLTASGSLPDGSDEGVLERMYKALKGPLDDLVSKAGNPNATDETTSTISNELYNMEYKLDSMKDRLVDLENRYYRQFTTMEQVINRYNTQSGYLSNMFG